MQLLNLVIKGAFDKYIGVFKPYLLAALDNHEDSQVCIAAVGAVAELCKAFEVKISPIMDEIMAELFAILQVHTYCSNLYYIRFLSPTDLFTV